MEFTNFQGEAFYNNLMEDFIGILEEHDLLEESEGALVVNLEEEECHLA